MIYIFSKAGAFYNRIDISGNFQSWKVKRESGDGKRCPLSIIQEHGHLSRHKGQHPTEKPCELYKWLIERYCPPGGTILDPTAGSFNSCFTAYELDRHAIGIEKDDAFYKKASEKADTL
jgi:site-specific DNA-methyltransferase (adenine-specific)